MANPVLPVLSVLSPHMHFDVEAKMPKMFRSLCADEQLPVKRALSVVVHSVDRQHRDQVNLEDENPLRNQRRSVCFPSVVLHSKKAGKLEAPGAFNSVQHRLNKEEEEAAMREDENDSDLCPVECVREFKCRSEFDDILRHAKEGNALVVVDFYRTACGSCKYIEKGFSKLCKGAGSTNVPIVFLKHNVMDEYDEQSEMAESLKIGVVPLFHFYKNGELVDAFATREKNRIMDAINKHTGRNLTLADVDLSKN